nr:PREDICTED: uncharacterized protein LOC109037661 [Bemisia tabaci]
MPHFHVPKYKVDVSSVADFLDEHKSGQAFSYPLKDKHDERHVQPRTGTMSPLSSVTFFTLMLALHVLQNSLSGNETFENGQFDSETLKTSHEKDWGSEIVCL